MAPESRNYDVEPIFQEIHTTTSTSLDQFIPPPHIYFILLTLLGRSLRNNVQTNSMPGHLGLTFLGTRLIVYKPSERSISRGSEINAVVVPSGQNQESKQPNVCHDLAEKYTAVLITILL